MPKLTVAPRIRSFICLNAHPVDCAANVEREIAVATQNAPGSGLKHVLVIGASTGYGLSSLVTGVFGYGARGTAICLERAAHGERTASAGYYNLAAAQRLARARGKQIVVINGDAFSEAVKQETLARVAASGVKLTDEGTVEVHVTPKGPLKPARVAKQAVGALREAHEIAASRTLAELREVQAMLLRMLQGAVDHGWTVVVDG